MNRRAGARPRPIALAVQKGQSRPRLARMTQIFFDIMAATVIGGGLGGDRVESGGGGFVVAQPGAGGGLVEDLDDLGAQAAGELPVPAEGVLPGDPALLVRGGAQRQVCLAEQPMMGDHAVPGAQLQPRVRLPPGSPCGGRSGRYPRWGMVSARLR